VIDTLLSWVLDLIEGVFGLLPEWHLPSLFGMQFVTRFIAALDYLVPIMDLMVAIGALFAMFPVFFAARMALFIVGLVRGGGA